MSLAPFILIILAVGGFAALALAATTPISRDYPPPSRPTGETPDPCFAASEDAGLTDEGIPESLLLANTHDPATFGMRTGDDILEEIHD